MQSLARWIQFALFLLMLLSLTGCSALVRNKPTPLPTIMLDNKPGPAQASSAAGSQSTGGDVTASGVIAPAQQAQMASTLGGTVQELKVEVGDQVQAGQVMLKLAGSEKLTAAVAAANVELLAAQQVLDDLNRNASVDRAAAMQAVAEANRGVRDAQYKVDTFTIPTAIANLDPVEAVQVTKNKLDQARAAFEPLKYNSINDTARRNLLNKLSQAQSDYDAAVRRLENRMALSQANAQLDKALKDYEALKDGPDPEKLKAAQARITAAQAQLTASQAALNDLELKAPFAGTVGQLDIHSGEWLVAGQTILVLADLQHLRVETTDLSERDIPKVKIGQQVKVYVKALNQEIVGHVSAISPLSASLGGDVVYKTTIDLDQQPAGLRAGMSVEVRFAGN